MSPEADRYRRNRLCPFNNRVPSCTKDKANDPLGTCSIYEGNDITITCPIRFRQDWIIADDAAAFFFPPGTSWTSLTEIRINDNSGQSAGNIDVALVAYNDKGRVIDFGALEVQAVYISGNIRRPFEHYMEDPANRYDMEWKRPDFPRPDYLSSSRKRLAPQLIYKGGILKSWGRKQAVALHRKFYNTLPALPETPSDEAEMAWLLYDLVHDTTQNRYNLVLHKTIYTKFLDALERITLPQAGPVGTFINHLQERLDEKMDTTNPPDAPTLTDLIDI